MIRSLKIGSSKRMTTMSKKKKKMKEVSMQPCALVINRGIIHTEYENMECNHPSSRRRMPGLVRSQDQDQGAVALYGPARQTCNQTPARAR